MSLRKQEKKTEREARAIRQAELEVVWPPIRTGRHWNPTTNARSYGRHVVYKKDPLPDPMPVLPDTSFDLEKLKERCLCDINDFRKEGRVVDTKDGIYVHKDNGSNILAVAHLDYVRNDKHFFGAQVKDEVRVYNGQLDDRLGAHIILDIFPLLGIKVDILLTDGEESGRSTAQHFETVKQYDWICEFDRRGTDAVMYDYETDELKALTEAHGFDTGWGSVSDISYLEHLGVSAINFGTAYYNEHCYDHYFVPAELERQLCQFHEFYMENKQCIACRQPFQPRPQVPNKSYCSEPDCRTKFER